MIKVETTLMETLRINTSAECLECVYSLEFWIDGYFFTWERFSSQLFFSKSTLKGPGKKTCSVFQEQKG